MILPAAVMADGFRQIVNAYQTSNATSLLKKNADMHAAREITNIVTQWKTAAGKILKMVMNQLIAVSQILVYRVVANNVEEDVVILAVIALKAGAIHQTIKMQEYLYLFNL